MWADLKTPKSIISRIKRVAIDGPAGSGKTTLARALADVLNLDYLDTGAMYRAVTCAVIDTGVNLDNKRELWKILLKLKIDIEDEKVSLNGKDITQRVRSEEVTEKVSRVAANQQVRKYLRKKQRKWVRKNKGGVLEGRDIGTIVLPKAELKVYLEARPEVRAERRAKESGRTPEETLKSIQNRDKKDSERKFNPLREAQDAIHIDTSEKDIQALVEEVLNRFQDRIEEKMLAGMNLGAPPRKPGYMMNRFLRRMVIWAFRIYCRGRILNRKKIPKTGAVILAPAGHRSNLDTLVVGAACRRFLYYMAKDTLFIKSRRWNRFLIALGGFPVKRNRLDRNSMEIAAEILNRGDPLVVFPEGMRQTGPTVMPLFGGLAWLSMKTGAPILPIGLAGGEKAMPVGRIFIRPHRISVIIGDLQPAFQKNMSRAQRQEKSEELRQILQKLYDEAKAL